MDTDRLVQILGTSAAIISVASFTPQVWKIVRTGDVSGVSKRMFLLTALGFTLWLSYGILKGEWPLIVPNALCLLASLTILVLTIIPQRKRDNLSDQVSAGEPH